jgi:hypothetical protein
MGVVVVHVVVLLQFEFHLTDQTLPRELQINVFNECSIPTSLGLCYYNPSWRIRRKY